MLQLVLGRSGSGKTRYVLNKAVEYGQNNVVLVVPEQFTMETERRLLDAFNTDALPLGLVTSFSGMATSYLNAHPNRRQCGYINNFGRRVLMSRALRNQNSAMNVYNGRVTTALADAFVSVATELKTSCISPDGLMSKLNEFSNPSIRGKLHDIAVAVGEYEALINEKYLDSLDDLNLLAEGIAKHGIFKGKYVIFDGFNNYSAQQERVIAAIMAQAEQVTVTVPCSSVTDMGEESDGSIFENARADAQRILGAAARLNIPVMPAVLLKDNKRAKTAEMKALERSIVSVTQQIESCNGIHLYNTQNTAEEAELLASLIVRDTEKHGCRYSDCAVIARSLDGYKSILPDAFLRAGIPYYMDIREDVTLRPLFTLVMSAVKVASGDRREENIFTCLKTGFFDATADEIFALENYALMWNLKGDSLFEEYTLNPRGYEEMNEKSSEQLAEFNRIRRRVMPCLQGFCRSLRGSFTGEDFCREIYSLLCRLDVPRKLDAESKELKEKGELVKAEEELRLWELFVNVIDQIYLTAGDEELTARTAQELFKLACDDIDMGRIPPTADCVTVGAADRIRTSDIKHVYIIGLNEGNFPASASPSGILTDREREEMKNNGLPLGGDASYWSIEEMFIAYKAFTSASEHITAIYPRATSSGDKLRPSPLVFTLKRLFPTLREISAEEVSPFERAITENAALSLVASAWNSSDGQIEELKRHLTLQREFAPMMQVLQSGRSAGRSNIQSREISRALFGKDMHMSASKLDVYHECPQRFFLKYGLLLKPRVKLSLKADSIGTFIHFILEKTLKDMLKEDIKLVDTQRLRELIDKWSEVYSEKVMGGLEGKTAGFVYLFGRLKKLAIAVLMNICDEMRQSLFHPDAFELTIGKNGEIPPYVISCEEGSVSIEGMVDRVDKMTEQGGYLRIVDYKTGTKIFSLNDILYGLNMQMLIYLFALQSGSEEYSRLVPGGVLYFPASRLSHTAEAGEKNGKNENENPMCMNGLLLKDIDCLRGMESKLEKRFIPITLSKKDGSLKGGVTVTEEELKIISDYIDSIIADMHKNLTEGNIGANPVKGCKKDGCKYCDYISVCGRNELLDPSREITSHSAEQAMAKMRKISGKDEYDA